MFELLLEINAVILADTCRPNVDEWNVRQGNTGGVARQSKDFEVGGGRHA